MTTQPLKFSPALAALVPLLLVFIYSYPRLIVAQLGTENPWTSYLYQYGFGLVFFLIGIWLILKTRACQFDRGRDAFWFKVLIFGFIFFSGGHAIWIYLALKIPYLGGP